MNGKPGEVTSAPSGWSELGNGVLNRLQSDYPSDTRFSAGDLPGGRCEVGDSATGFRGPGERTGKLMTLDVLLSNHAFTQGLTRSQIQSLAAFARIVAFGQGESVVAYGLRPPGVYLILSGSVTVEARTSASPACVQVLGPDQTVGWSTLLEPEAAVFEVRALQQTVAVCLDGDALRVHCRKDRESGLALFRRTLGLLEQRIQATEVRFAEISGLRL